MRSRLNPALRRLGPALRKDNLPLGALGVSALGHALAMLGVGVLLLWGVFDQPKVHIVNLVPAVAALGSPTAPPSPALPARPTTPLAARAPAPEPEPREAAREAPREAPRLPEPSPPGTRLPSRASIQPGEKELPPLAGPATRERSERTGEQRPAPAPPPGQPTGSPSAVGPVALDASDFPYAWYLRQVLQKVEARWQQQPPVREPDQKPLIFVEIRWDGKIATPRIDKSSGDALYDQAALRAVTEASPFPPLPEEWVRKVKPTLGILFRFDVQRGQG